MKQSPLRGKIRPKVSNSGLIDTSNYAINVETSQERLIALKAKREIERMELDLQVFHEARLLQHELAISVEEANQFASDLGELARFSICLRGKGEEDFWRRVEVDPHGVETFPPQGTAKRIEGTMIRLSVEGTVGETKETGEISSLLTLRQFRNEHSRLHRLHQSRFGQSAGPELTSISLNRDDIERKMRRALEDAVEETKLLEAQIREIRKKGWNLG